MCLCVCVFNASGDETPTESSTTSLNALGQVCYSAAVGPRALSQNFAFLVPVETSKLAIYVLKKFAMKQKLGLSRECQIKVRKRIN